MDDNKYIKYKDLIELSNRDNIDMNYELKVLQLPVKKLGQIKTGLLFSDSLVFMRGALITPKLVKSKLYYMSCLNVDEFQYKYENRLHIKISEEEENINMDYLDIYKNKYGTWSINYANMLISKEDSNYLINTANRMLNEYKGDCPVYGQEKEKCIDFYKFSIKLFNKYKEDKKICGEISSNSFFRYPKNVYNLLLGKINNYELVRMRLNKGCGKYYILKL